MISDKSKTGFSVKNLVCMASIYLLVNYIFLLFNINYYLSNICGCLLAYYGSYLFAGYILKSKYERPPTLLNMILIGFLNMFVAFFIVSILHVSIYVSPIIVLMFLLPFTQIIQKKGKLVTEKQTIILMLAGAFLVAIKLVLCSSQYASIYSAAGHDDGLMLNLSRSITAGNWLGTYSDLTLAKGMFYPLWVTINHALSIPILRANQLFYAAACFFMILALSPVIKNKSIRFLLFGFLLFNPTTFDATMMRIYRDSIYPALCLLLFAGFIGLFLRRKQPKRMIWYALIGGCAFLAAWNTREDSFWLLPFVIAVILITLLFVLFDKNDRSLKKTAVTVICLMFPVIILLAGNSMISLINYTVYGRYVLNDYMSDDFTSAYGALTRVEHENWIMDVPVPEDVRKKAYEVSPAFKELEPYLEEGSSGFKMQIQDNRYDYKGGWFFWALRQAVKDAGYYETPTKAKEFYERLAKEVNDACDTGLLKATTGSRSTLSPPFRSEYVDPLLKNSVSAAIFVVCYKDVQVGTRPSYIGSDEANRKMADYVHEIFLSEDEELSQLEIKNQNILAKITALYQQTNPIITIIGFVCFIIQLIYVIWRLIRRKKIKNHSEILILLSFALLFILRIVMIAFVQVSSFDAIHVMYLSSAYPILLLFSGLSFVFFAQGVLQHYAKKTHEKGEKINNEQ